MQLATQCLLRRFAVFAFAARKFPKPGKVLAGRTLRQKDPALVVAENSGDDMDGRLDQVQIRQAGRGIA